MSGVEWLKRRKSTISLVSFFISWFVVQSVVFQVFGRETAAWWFYIEYPPRITPGILFSVVSHDFTTFTHIGANTVLLTVVGGFGEPYIGQERVVFSVVGLGYLGILLANLLALILGQGLWIFAGASAGVLSLLAYTGLRNRKKASDLGSEESFWSSQEMENFVALFLLFAIPGLLVYEVLLNTPTNSSHVIGILLGSAYFGVETLSSSE